MYVHKDTKSFIQDELIKNEINQIELQYNAFKEQKYNELLKENQELKQKYEMQKDSNKLLCKAITCDDCNCSVCEAHKENVELKKQLEDTNEELELVRCDLHNRTSERDSYYRNIEILENQQKEFILYLENEKDRLARECSQIYEDSLGKTRLVNEDIFNEVDKILSKYQEIIGVSE